jgi:hypothetical protein
MNTVTMIAIAMAIATMMGGRGLLTGASYRAGPAATRQPSHLGMPCARTIGPLGDGRRQSWLP